MAAAKPTIFSGDGKAALPLVTQLIANDGKIAEPISAFKPILEEVVDIDNLKQDAGFVKGKIKSLIPFELSDWPVLNKTVSKVFMDLTGVNIGDGLQGKELRRIANMARNESFNKDKLRQRYSFGEDVEVHEVMKVVDAIKKMQLPNPIGRRVSTHAEEQVPYLDKYPSVSSYTTAWASILDKVRGLRLYDAYHDLMGILATDEAAYLAVVDQLPFAIQEGEIEALIAIEQVIPAVEMVARYPSLITDFLLHFAIPPTNAAQMYQAILGFFQRTVSTGLWYEKAWGDITVLQSHLFSAVSIDTASFFLSNATEPYIINMVSVGRHYNTSNFSVPPLLHKNPKGVKVEYLTGLFA